ncbi:MAG: hypothetical protein LC792_11875 [Actinobacteria bacterium]|nr:hypothetical protein [Actinomycetota bacterium]
MEDPGSSIIGDVATNGPISWLADVSPASWVASRLRSALEDVGSIIPTGYAAYGRLFHPVEGTDEYRRWADVARDNGRIVHPEMQFHMINRPVGTPAPGGYEPGDGPNWGSLPLDERRGLIEHLSRHTTTPAQCWFCVWEGFGGLDDQGVAARVRLPLRDYLLRRGPIGAAMEPTPHRQGVGFGVLVATPIGTEPPELPGVFWEDQSPNLWWPEDRAWFVATEIDYAWTYIGGSTELIDELLADDRLEVLPARLTDKPFYDSDTANARLDDTGGRP